MSMKRLMSALMCVLLLAGCAGAQEELLLQRASDRWTAQLFAMDTLIQATVYAPELAEEELARIMQNLPRLEALLSATDPDSEISALNGADGQRVALSSDTRRLLETAVKVSSATGGAFDVTAYPLVKAWGFTRKEYRVPAVEELQALLERVDYRQIAFSEAGVTLPAGVEVDLGGIAKGYAGDMLTGALREAGVQSALISLGGNIALLGGKPDGSKWRIGVRDPLNTAEPLGYVEVWDTNVVTSGGYERCFEDEAGNIWWYIIDPATGYPAKNGLLSATVIGEEGAMCDALSTALFVMGPERAAQYLRQETEVEALLVREDGSLLVTGGLKDSLTLLGARTVEWIAR